MKRVKPEKTTMIAAAAMLLAVLYCVGLMVYACHSNAGAEAVRKNDSGMEMSYEDLLFDTSYVHTIELSMDEDDWQDLKANAFYKDYYDCTITVDGETFYHVGVRTKGNSSLLKSVMSGTDKLSLYLDFGQFHETQRYHGLDTIAMYNSNCDSSYLRSFICMDMMRSAGVPTSLCTFTAVYLNGEYLGLYTAFEGVRESFAIRNFGNQYGNLYKPEHMDMPGVMTGRSRMNFPTDMNPTAFSDPTQMDFGVALGSIGDVIALKYQGSQLSDYDMIWDTSVFDIGTSDKTRLVEAIRLINEGNLETSVNKEELAKYFAVSTFVLNTDSYTTSMAHNYYLYEKDGYISMLPWDYDMALGSLGTSFATPSMTEFLNLAIYTPVSGTEMEDRPLLNALMQDAEWWELYHQELQDLVDNYVSSGYAAQRITELEAMIRPYVEAELADDEKIADYETSVQSIYDFVSIRAESISGQLTGTIPATTEGQQAAPETLVDASGYTAPAEGNFMEQMFTAVDGDGIVNMIRQVNFAKLLFNMPIGDMIGSISGESGMAVPSMPENMSFEFPELDTETVAKLVLTVISALANQILFPLLSLILLPIVLIKLYRTRKKRRPQPIEKAQKGAIAYGANSH